MKKSALRGIYSRDDSVKIFPRKLIFCWLLLTLTFIVISPLAGQAADLVIVPGITIEGNVYDRDSSNPLPGVKISSVLWPILSTVTDNTGYFSISNPGYSYDILRLDKEGYIPLGTYYFEDKNPQKIYLTQFYPYARRGSLGKPDPSPVLARLVSNDPLVYSIEDPFLLKDLREPLTGVLEQRAVFGMAFGLNPKMVSEFSCDFSVKICGVTLTWPKQLQESYGSNFKEVGCKCTFDELNTVMAASSFPYAEGELHFSLGQGAYVEFPQKRKGVVKFKAELPRYEGLYRLNLQAKGLWERVTGNLEAARHLFLITHGWQSTSYPSFEWMELLAYYIQSSYGGIFPVYAWFWQEEATDRAKLWWPGQAFSNISAQTAALVEKLKGVLPFMSDSCHFIGHSFGGAIASGALQALVASGTVKITASRLTVLDAPEAEIYPMELFAVNLQEILFKFPAAVIIENYYSQFGKAYKLYNVCDYQIEGDHAAPIWYYLYNRGWFIPRCKNVKQGLWGVYNLLLQ